MLKHKTNKKKRKNWRSAKSNECKKVLNFSYCSVPNWSLLNLSKNKSMIGRNILLKASTIVNQSLVFVSCLRKRIIPLQFQFISRGWIQNIFQGWFWKKSFVSRWQVYLICFDVWLNVYYVHWEDAYEGKLLYCMFYISKEIWLTALLSLIHKNSSLSFYQPFLLKTTLWILILILSNLNIIAKRNGLF